MDFLSEHVTTMYAGTPFEFEYTISEETYQKYLTDGGVPPTEVKGDPANPKSIGGEDVTRFYMTPTWNEIGMEVMVMHLDEVAREYDISAKTIKATKIALQGYSYYIPEDRQREAKKALEIDPNCAEAYNLLGISQNNFEAALECFLKGAEVAPMMSLTFNTMLKAKEVWHCTPLRAYFRAIFNTANTLRKMKRYKDSLQYYLKLIDLDNNWYTYSSYVNFRYHIPELFLRLKDYDGMKNFVFKKCKDILDDCVTYTSICIPWIFGICLFDFASGKQRSFPIGTSSLIYESVKNGSAVLAACEAYFKTIEYLIGEKRLPRFRLPSTMGKAHGELQAIIYASSALDLWESVPGAIPWLRKVYNTFWATSHVTGSVITIPRPEVASFEFYKKRLEGGFFDNCPTDSSGKFFIHEVVMGKKVKPQHVEELLKHTKNVNTTFHLTPLNMACYYDSDPLIVDMLVRAGAQLCPPNVPIEMSPLAMAANQGNWRTIQLAVEHYPELAPTPTAKQNLLCKIAEMLCSSSVPYCLMGMERCNRCVNDPSNPHPKTTDFKKAIDILIYFGLPEKFKPSMPSHPISSYLRLRKREGGIKQFPPILSLSNPGNTPLLPPSTSTSASKPKQVEAKQQAKPTQAKPAQPAAKIVEILDDQEAEDIKKGEKKKKQEKERQREKEQDKEKLKEKKCLFCDKQKEGLLVCSRCRAAWYCDRECQKAHWKIHKATCVSQS